MNRPIFKKALFWNYMTRQGIRIVESHRFFCDLNTTFFLGVGTCARGDIVIHISFALARQHRFFVPLNATICFVVFIEKL